MKTKILILIFTVLLLKDGVAQPILGLLMPREGKNVTTGTFTNNTSVIIQNTGITDIQFFMASSASVSFSLLGLKVNAGTTVSTTVEKLGGINAGNFLNALNLNITSKGSFALRLGGGLPMLPQCELGSGDPNAWQAGGEFAPIDGQQNIALQLCDVYSTVKIGKSGHLSDLQVSRNTSIGGSLIINGPSLFSGATFSNNTIFNSKVGIGLSSPDANLHINSTGGQKDLLITHSGVDYDYAAIIRVDNDLTKAFTIEKNGPSTPVFRVDGNGNTYVGGTLKASVLKATANVWSDFVFDKDYQLMSLKELEKYIIENNHLPEMPTTAEVMKEGIDVAEVQAKLLQKVEELTLHLIELKKENEVIKEELRKLKN